MTRWATAKLAGVLAVAVAGLGSAAHAQVPPSEYSLPPAPQSPPRNVQGPTDPDHPILAPRPATNSPSPPATSAAPAIRLPAPRPTDDARQPRARPTPGGSVAPGPVASEPAPASPPTASLEATAAPTAIAPPAERVPQPTAIPTAESSAAAPWMWLALGAGLIAVAAGVVLLLRRRRSPNEVEWLETGPEPESLPEPKRKPELPQPTTGSTPAAPLELRLEALRLSISLVYATIAYRLTLYNRGEQETGAVTIAGDLISAHGSRSTEEQLVLDGQLLETRHRISTVPPGEAVSLDGELRLALSEIVPIRNGGAQLFVPLVRFRVETADAATTGIFAVGQRGEHADGALRPVNLDLGPRTIRELEQRPVPLPA